MKRTKHVGIRRFAAVALPLILCVTMAPLGVWAEGGISLSDGDVPDFTNTVTPNNLSAHEHRHEDGNVFVAWGDKPGEQYSLPNSSGDVKAIYLTRDIQLNDTYIPRYPVQICLNGHKITMNKASGSTGAWSIMEANVNSGSLELYDCTGEGAIDGEGKNNCVTAINAGLVMDNVNIINGQGYSRNGGVDVSINTSAAKRVELRNVRIQDCSAQSGGAGLHISSATSAGSTGNAVHLSNVMVCGCSAASDYSMGGGVYLSGSNYTVENLNIDGCTSNADGGGLHLTSFSGDIDNLVIRNNTAAEDGGGLYVNGFKGSISGLEVTGNTSGRNGGGIYVSKGVTAFGPYVMEIPWGTNLSGNTAENDGGGLYAGPDTEVAVRAPVTGNTASMYGGGIYDGGSVKLAASVTGNKAPFGGGVYVKRDAPFEVLYGAKVTGNTSSSNYNNIRLGYDAFVTIGDLYEKADLLGVSTENQATASNPVTISQNFETILGSDANVEDYFVPEGDNVLMEKRNGEAVLYRHDHSWTLEHPDDDPSTAVLKCIGGTCVHSEGYTISIYPDPNNEYYSTVNPRFAYVSIVDNKTGERIRNIPADAWVTVFQNDSIDYYTIAGDGTETLMPNGSYPRDAGNYRATARIKDTRHQKELGEVTVVYPILKPLAEGTVESRGTLPYGGGNQNLVTAKNVKYGTPMYYVSDRELTEEEAALLDKSGFTQTARRSASGTYYVYWYIKGDSNHSDTEIAGPLTAVISERQQHDEISFIQWDSADSLPAAEGNYYLTRDVVLSDRWAAPSGSWADMKRIGLCLNGHSIT